MCRNFFLLILFLLSCIGTFAQVKTDTVSVDFDLNRLKPLKSLINSRVWQPVDSVSNYYIEQLISDVESIPGDVVVVGLQHNIDAGGQFFKRSVNHVPDVDKIEGYIPEREIANAILDIEKRVHDEFPYESILVPENKFFGMYAKIPIVTYSNTERLITDSLISIPDSIKILLDENKTTRSAKKIKENEQVIEAFLNIERKKYNDDLIDNYRESIIRSYRNDFLDTKINSQKRAYFDSVSKINSALIKQYNDSVTNVVNSNVTAILKDMLAFVNRKTNEISVYNLMNERTMLPLQNDTEWFRWVWLKNQQNDSIGIRVENINKNTIRLMVDETVNLSKLKERQTLDVVKITPMQNIEHTLLKINAPKIKVSPWRLEGRAYSGFTQTFINSYWSTAKGGKSSASILSTFNYSANYSSKKMKWENWVDAKVGYVYYRPEEGSTALRNWTKNSDNFEINSRFGWSAFKKWYYSAEANFKTQLFWGFKNNNDSIPNSAWLSPAYLTFSGGFDYKPNNEFSAFISPLSVKTTYVTNPYVDETVFGLIEGRTHKSRIGMGGKVEFTKKLMEGVVLRSKNSIFVNFGYNNKNEFQLFKVPDFDTENTIDFKVNQFITTQVNMHFVYDKDVESKWTKKENGVDVEKTGTRFLVKEFLTLGISYKFK